MGAGLHGIILALKTSLHEPSSKQRSLLFRSNDKHAYGLRMVMA
jgi:hypothetical protein